MNQMESKKVVVWFRQDLRVHDNEALTHAIAAGNEVIPIFIFDDRIFKAKTRFGFPKTGVHRAKFTIEAVEDLRKNIQALGSELIVRSGNTEDEIYKICKEVKSSWVFCNRERTFEEVAIQDALEQNLWSIGQEIIYSRGKMLYYTQDLPFPITHTPDVFTAFRKEVEKFTTIREPLKTPEKLPGFSDDLESGEIPSLSDFGFVDYEFDQRSVLDFKGGESAGLNRLKYYLWDTDLIKNYKETRNGLLGANYSTKLSPWLSLGCLSPKKVFSEVKKYETERGSNKSTYWLFFELMWRDFFRLMGKKYGNAIFKKGGLIGKPNDELTNDMRITELWTQGRTGMPFIDANMKELNATGFMSNRGRQNVASFLVKDLKINWQIGADYFESQLIDYDPCSNYCNWNYLAGVGNDPREDRHFNILSQAKRYDPHGEYVRRWLPELDELPNNRVHQPDILSQQEQEDFHLKLGINYPKSMVSSNRWA